MKIESKVHLPDSCSSLRPEAEAAAQQLEEALRNSAPESSDDSVWSCQLSVNCNLSEDNKSQFARINGNMYVGFSVAGNNYDRMRRSFLLRCISLRPRLLQEVENLVVLISRANDGASGGAPADGKDSEVSEFTSSDPKYSLSKVIVDSATKAQIDRSLALIRNQKLIFDDWGFREVDPNTKTILCFFGAPGTGKTMCAHAIARELGKRIMIASYASIESKWVGEGPKNMRRIFEDAARQDAVLFFDEADSFLSKRVGNAETGSDKHYNRMSNEMFQLLEDYDGIVIFATNMVTDFDKAFKSRILSFIEFTLPDQETRARLIATMLPEKLPLERSLDEADFTKMAEASDGFSGRELRKAVLSALSEAALNGRRTLNLNDLIAGFETVRAERDAIEESSSSERKEILHDFLATNDENKSILDICLWAAWQGGNVDDRICEEIFNISRVLNLGMPDMSISYAGKDLSAAFSTVKASGRAPEAMLHAVKLFALSASDSDFEAAISHLCQGLGESDSDRFIHHYHSLTNIFSKQ